MKQFQKRLYLFIFIFIVIICIDLILQKTFLYKKNYFKLPSNTTNVIFGHSHVEYGYNTKLIKNTVNLGSSGEAYIYTYYKTKNVIENNAQIKNVFIEFTNNQIDPEMDNWTWDTMHLQYQLKNYFFLMNYDDLVFLYKKNSSGFQSAFSKMLFNNLAKLVSKRNIENGDFGGYNAKNKNKIEDENTNDVNDNNLNKNNISKKMKISGCNIFYLEKLVNLCLDKKIKVFLVRTPMSKNYSTLRTESTYKNILLNKFKTIQYYDFKDYPLLDSDFLDKEHLNSFGALKYSKFFNDTISKLKN